MIAEWGVAYPTDVADQYVVEPADDRADALVWLNAMGPGLIVCRQRGGDTWRDEQGQAIAPVVF